MELTGSGTSRVAHVCAPLREAAALERVDQPSEAMSSNRPLRILHLEDNPADTELARDHLVGEDIRCAIRRVETEEDYRSALYDGGIDLIIADYQLPDFNGLAAFEIARQFCPDVPFIMLTGKLGEEYAIDTLKLGVTDYVLKKSLPSRLAPAVRRALTERRERAQRREDQDQLRRYREHLEDLVRLRTAELEERNRELAVANRDLESFITSATHDLRTPLVVIGGFTRLLLKSCAGKIDASDLELLRKVIAAVARMESLIDDLLGFFLAAKATPARAPINMETAFRQAFAELLPLVGERRVELKVAPLPEALGDPAMIHQVLLNLLANAIKYTGLRDAAVIEVSGWGDPNETGYRVRDNGVGFDMSFRERLFEIFQRLHDKAEFPGTGVGLAAVKRIVEKHGGKVWATGTVGEGAVFSFTLAKQKAEPARE